MRTRVLEMPPVVAKWMLVAALGVGVGFWTVSSARHPFTSMSVRENAHIPMPDEQKTAVVTRAFDRMPLYFIENRGQFDSHVAYYVQGRDTTLFFTANGMTLVRVQRGARRNPTRRASEASSSIRTVADQTEPVSRVVVKVDFVGANRNARIEAADRTPAVISYFRGSPDTWQAGLATYRSIVYPDLWPGIDLVFSGTANRLKYTFRVKPGADPARVRLAYRGIRGNLRVNDAGQLEAETAAGVIEDDRPYAYQDIDGRRVPVSAAYSVDPRSPRGEHRYGFALGAYDRSRPLELDPAVLVYAGYIGGSDYDYAYGIAVDSGGNAYVTGVTSSGAATFPVTVGPDLSYNGNGSTNAFIAKINAAGTALVYCGYIGSASEGHAVAVDSFGNAYVTGWTAATEANFPVIVGPDLTYNSGITDAFVAKVNAAGTQLLYSGFIGGAGQDYAAGIAVDPTGAAYVTGWTNSSELTFPVTVGPDLSFNGGADAYVAKVKADGTALDYCGYIGGDSGGTQQGNVKEEGWGIAVDGSGNAYVTGTTTSTEATFPVTVGPSLTYHGGLPLGDAFVAKVNATGTALVYCGYIGGTGQDIGYGIAVDSLGNAYITGGTNSSQATFPVIGGPGLTLSGTFDAFVAKVNPAGTAFVYSGYIGGSAVDQGYGVAVDGSGNAYVTGVTGSSQVSFPPTIIGFPVTGGPDLTFNGGTDAFVAKVSASGTSLIYCGYVGGTGGEEGRGIAVDAHGGAYIAGFTNSTQATFPVTVGPDLVFNGSPPLQDAFVAKIGDQQTFTDDPLVKGVTLIRAVQILELHARIDAVRTRDGLPGFAYTHPIVAGTSLVMAVDIADMRTALAEAYAAEMRNPPTYTDLAPGAPIKAEDITELRAALLAIE